MTTGHHSLARYARKSITRAAVSTLIAPLVRWQPLRDPVEGYTVVVGCNHRLLPMVYLNLLLLRRQQAPGCVGLIMVLDCTADEVPPDFMDRAREAAGPLPLRVIFYTPRQTRIARLIDWGWVYAWMSWSTAIGAATSRHVILHDFDALLLDPDVLEVRYRRAVESGAHYLGVRCYDGLGVIPEDRLVTTFELVADAQFVRQNFKPIDLFNHMGRMGDRRVEFDTFLYAQSRAGTAAVLPIDPDQMVHPSQMICQFVDFTAGRGRVPDRNNLLMIPYYFALGGDDALMRDLTRQLHAAPQVNLWGRSLDVARVPAVHADWFLEQASRMENALYSSTRPEVAAYFGAIKQRAGSAPPRPHA